MTLFWKWLITTQVIISAGLKITKLQIGFIIDVLRKVGQRKNINCQFEYFRLFLFYFNNYTIYLCLFYTI